MNRCMMLKILKAYDVPSRFLKAISKIYENTRARVITPDGDTEFFEVTTGVLQGDTLAPYLFAIVLDYILRQTYRGKESELGFQLERRRSRRNPPVTITDLDFADDIALLTEEIGQAQEVLEQLENEAAKIGLYCNAKKTKVQVFNHEQPVDIKVKNGTSLETVSNFQYLGGHTESTNKDFSVRKALAWNACHRMRKIWNTPLSRNIKIRLFVATVESVLLYGSAAWTLTKSLKNS